MEAEMEKLIKEKELQVSTRVATSIVVTSTPAISLATMSTTKTEPTHQNPA